YDRVETNEDTASGGEGTPEADDTPNDERGLSMSSPTVLLWGLLTSVAMLGWIAGLSWLAFHVARSLIR
ncbi:MAG: hypothetical protein ACJ8EL_11410, partial [Rhizomicrobium sp.]